MKIAVIGGTGASGRYTIRDLVESPGVKEILCADFRGEEAKNFAASFKDPRLKWDFVDAYNVSETAKLISGYDIVINTALYWTNVSVMKACLKAGLPYIDIGGLYHGGNQQIQECGDDFKKAGLTAIIGMGAGVGITNICARYGYLHLDTVQAVHIKVAAVDFTDIKGIDVYYAPFAIRTYMEEQVMPPVQFINGKYETLPLFSGEEEVDFPEPIGRRKVANCLHGELSTIPSSFKDKGIRDVTFKLGYHPWAAVEKSRFLASIGMASKTPIKVQGVEVVPLEVLASVVERQLTEKFRDAWPEFKGGGCFRVQVIGKKKARKTEYILDMFTEQGTALIGIPSSIVAQMMLKKEINNEPGVFGPEALVDPESFFKELDKRKMADIHITRKEYIK